MVNENSANLDAYVEIAKAVIRAYVEKGETVAVNGGGIFFKNGEACPAPALDYSPLQGERAGVFVSIKKTGALRGCIGTISPVRECVADEIVYNAINACSRDPRFYPVTPDELADLTVSVDVLADAEPIETADQLDPARYGVIVTRGGRRGLLLPNLEGVDTVGEQLAIALSKAGIGQSEKYAMERFEVVRHDSGGSMRGG